MKWWKRLFKLYVQKTYAPLAVDLETGEIYVWDGHRMINTRIRLASIGLPR